MSSSTWSLYSHNDSVAVIAKKTGHIVEFQKVIWRPAESLSDQTTAIYSTSISQCHRQTTFIFRFALLSCAGVSARWKHAALDAANISLLKEKLT